MTKKLLKSSPIRSSSTLRERVLAPRWPPRLVFLRPAGFFGDGLRMSCDGYFEDAEESS